MNISDIKIDFNEEISYGQDQANVTYPTVFPTVSFSLEPNDAFLELLEDGKGSYEYSIGISESPQRKVDNCITAVDEDGGMVTLDIFDIDENTLWDELDRQCRDKLGKGCTELLAEAREQMRD